MLKRNLVNAFLIASLSLIIFKTFAHTNESNFVEDTVITATVKSKLAADKTVSATAIQVETNNGTVSLKGNVKSHTEANRAVELAFSAPGVVEVNTTQLTVEGSNQPLSDALITAKVKGLFVREKVFGDKDISVSGIHVETADGEVFLSGKADNKTQIENAEKLAKSIKGVKKVKSSLEIKGK